MTGKSVRDVDRYQALLTSLLALEENKFCADCRAKGEPPSLHTANFHETHSPVTSEPFTVHSLTSGLITLSGFDMQAFVLNLRKPKEMML